jgi:hypothetical protein
MEEGVLDVELVNRPLAGQGKGHALWLACQQD